MSSKSNISEAEVLRAIDEGFFRAANELTKVLANDVTAASALRSMVRSYNTRKEIAHHE